MSANTERFDLIIVGGGPVGLSLAASIEASVRGARIAVLDRRAIAPAGDPRASAIAAGVRRLFEAIGVWNGMATGASPVNAMTITDSGGSDISRPALLSFSGDVAPGEPFAHMVPNTDISHALIAALGPGTTALGPVEVVDIVPGPNSVRVALAEGRVLDAPLVVGADGKGSTVRSLAGIKTFTRAYGQNGLVTTITHERAHEATAYQHFRPGGPFASLPLPGRRSSLVWTETAKRAQELAGWSSDALAREIETVTGGVLGAIEAVDPIQSYPLSLLVARRFVGQRLALVGDAAHVIHPLAGQGLNLGMKDVAALAELVVAAMRRGQDIGAPALLARYERMRGFDTGLMALATDGLNGLFSNDMGVLRAVRDLGLSAVDRVGPLKTGFIRHAAGLESRLGLVRGRAL
ncbi:FAD-dependent monooxygenase [Pelagibacterium montanilacus]|uniref:FAD-dependent monooxygenase n=1 Tax=Pelagibacterium montanilacus TaxID=2185280 RepID=UPI000F8EE510|nr:FAD-dependent monooxygenase [Pelagibacterium montanilacus]